MTTSARDVSSKSSEFTSCNEAEQNAPGDGGPVGHSAQKCGVASGSPRLIRGDRSNQEAL